MIKHFTQRYYQTLYLAVVSFQSAASTSSHMSLESIHATNVTLQFHQLKEAFNNSVTGSKKFYTRVNNSWIRYVSIWTVTHNQPTKDWCILESKRAALVAAVFVDFPKNNLYSVPSQTPLTYSDPLPCYLQTTPYLDLPVSIPQVAPPRTHITNAQIQLTTHLSTPASA